jgi:hypothetical protein
MAAPADLDALFASDVGRHSPEATTANGSIDLGFCGLRLTCYVETVLPFSGIESAKLSLDLGGGGLRAPITLTMIGYAPTVEQAIVRADRRRPRCAEPTDGDAARARDSRARRRGMISSARAEQGLDPGLKSKVPGSAAS